MKHHNRVLATALRYVERGLAVVPVPFSSKECRYPGWQSERLSEDRLEEQFNGEPKNIAAAFGKLSDDVVVVDCDWPEAAQLAQRLLPRTAMFGRDSSPASHYLIKSPTETTRHSPPSNVTERRSCVIEILSTGHLCLLPGSTHPDGELIRFEPGHRLSVCPVAEMDCEDLQRRVSRIAGGAVLAYHWPEYEGSRHDLTLALVGSCLHSGRSAEDVAAFFNAFFAVAIDTEAKDRIACVKSTLVRFSDGETISGWPSAAPLLADLASFIQSALSLNSNTLDTLIINNTLLGSAVAPDAGWPELIPFDRLEAGSAEYPLTALGALTPVVSRIADIQQVPIALAAQSVLSGLSTAAQGLFDVAVDFHFRCPLSLWMILVAVPGERKSTTDALVLEAHRQWQMERVQRYRLDIDNYETTPKEERQGRPRMPILLPSGGTTEGLLKALNEAWPSVGLVNNDAGDFLHGYSMREGRAPATLSVLSRLWDGAYDVAVKASSEPLLLFGRRLSLSLMMQPAVVPRMFENDFGGQGFNSRCLLAYPASTIGTRPLKVSIEKPLEVVQFHQRMQQLLDTPLDINPATGAITTTALTLEPRAFHEYERCFNRLEYAMGPNGDNRDILETANKAATNLLRVAGNLVVYEGRQNLTAQDICNADAIINFYLEEWRAIASKVDALNPARQKIHALLQWLRDYVKNNPGPFKLSVVYQRGPRAGGRNADDAKRLLNELQRRGYVRPVSDNRYELRPEDLS